MNNDSKSLAIRALENERANWSDNLARARSAARRHDPNAPYCGTTGKSINDLIGEYEAGVAQYDAAIAELSK